MGRPRRYLGTNELPRLDLRSAECRAVLQGVPRPDSGLPPGRLLANGTPVELAFSPCRFGGYRPWLLCSCCSQRRLVLYAREFVQQFLKGDEFVREERWFSWRCRRCWHLTYPSQRASRNWMWYAQLQVMALVGRYYPDWHYGDRFPSKPPRVWRRTWERLCQAVEEWEAVADEAFWRRVSRYLPIPA
ncbi:MAG: hypothetical protein QN178_08535 [Armatimonadota bacterium]|nr:hypothetical protein [Armatimonadota bacterium]